MSFKNNQPYVLFSIAFCFFSTNMHTICHVLAMWVLDTDILWVPLLQLLFFPVLASFLQAKKIDCTYFMLLRAFLHTYSNKNDTFLHALLPKMLINAACLLLKKDTGLESILQQEIPTNSSLAARSAAWKTLKQKLLPPFRSLICQKKRI